VFLDVSSSDLPLWYLQTFLTSIYPTMGKDTNMYISTFKQIVVDEDEKNNGEIQKVAYPNLFHDISP
jgi:hypothetical protein